MRILFFAALAASLLFQAGCVSSRTTPNNAASAQSAGIVGLGTGVTTFRDAKHRWPHDYEELLSFLEDQSDPKWEPVRKNLYNVRFLEVADNGLHISGVVSGVYSPKNGRPAATLPDSSFSMTINPTADVSAQGR